MARILLTRRALADLSNIQESSIEKFGKKTASKYMASIEDILKTIQEYPDILRDRPYSKQLQFYTVEKHTLVFTSLNDNVYVLTVKHSRMNIEERIKVLEPTLLQEAEIMYKRLKGSKEAEKQ